ncbi:MAG: NifU family protein [Hyphomicrobiaceae bacterium]|nr:NifU family protein [Hyphomicrobiaceae bacterium]
MFIQTEPTPNPSTLKFVPGKQVLASGVEDFKSLADAGNSPLATRLFEVDGVAGVFLGNDFISVTKGDLDWDLLKPAVMGVIMEHFMSGAPVMEGDAQGDNQNEVFDEEDRETVDTIKQLLEEKVRPAVAQDGGDIIFQAYKDGIVYLELRGACSGCPSSTATLKNGVENLLKHFLPEVKEVRSA